MSKWPETTIEQLKALSKNAIAMGPFGSRIKAENFVKEGIPIIKGGNLNGDFILEDNFDYLTEEKATELKSSNAFRRDIVITHRGTIGQVGIIPDNSIHDRYVVSQSQLKVTLNQEIVNPYFVYYFLRSPLGQHRLLMNASQVGVPAIAKASTSVKGILVPTPELHIQDQVVEILLNLDHKIELNRQTNQTLEQIAQAIFKSWFVDFEPVKAKIHAKEKAQDPELAAMCAISGKSAEQLNCLDVADIEQLKTTAGLFPYALIESVMGDIPNGWEAKKLSTITSVIGGGTPKRSESDYWNGDIPWFSIKDIPNQSDVFVVDTKEKITEIGLKKSSTKLLPIGSTIITARGTVGKLALVGEMMCMNQSCYGIVGIDGIGPYFNYFNLREAISTLKRNTHGAVFDTITTKTFDSYIMAIRIDGLVERFEKVVTSQMEEIKSNVIENIILTKTKDVLLPKLLSGAINPIENQVINEAAT